MAAARKQAAKAGQAALAVKANPYIQRLIEDADLRDDIRQAVDQTRSAYKRLSNGKAPAKALMEDRKLQRDLRNAATSVRDVTVTLREGPKRKRRLRLGRVLLLALIGGGAALAASEGLRKKALDALFGAEEEFDYTSTSAPATPETAAA
jgi:hypothetical protein